MTTLVTGTRGSVGRTLVHLLARQGAAVRAASSDPEGLSLPDGAVPVRCDLTDPTTFPAALEGATSVFLYAEPARIETFLDRAVEAGVQHIVLLSSSAVLAGDAAPALIATRHRDVEKALESAPVTSTFLRPGGFATNALQWSWPIRATGAVGLPFPEVHTDPLHERDLAECALAALTDPALAGGRYTLTGPESLTFADQIERIARVTGRPIAVTPVDRDTWKKSVSEFLPDAVADALYDAWQAAGGSLAPLSPAVEELTGHPARTFEEWVRDHVDAFRD
ncbi:NmrA family NAD(P)-binding protein [Streptomyces sp. URMC 123]|uniref:NmrA family NAD(P)-binding protein n=1 Tax=Streptomyces sp. URMC 123 TaxID=3423403 RepID=UPI003F1AF456